MFLASGRVNRALKVAVAELCISAVDCVAAFRDSIKAVESSAVWKAVRAALARVKSTATPTDPISGIAVKASIGAMPPRQSLKKRISMLQPPGLVAETKGSSLLPAGP